MTYQPKFNSYTSTDNSSTSTLTNGSTFTGTWEDVKEYESVIVAVTADQDGVFYIDFSPDGTNADSTLTRYYNTSDIEAPHRFTITRRYFRVRFTNDSGSGQSAFRLQTTVKAASANLNAPIDGTLSRDYDATVVRPTNFDDEVAMGLRQGHSTWNKFGFNADVDSGSEEIVAAFGGTFSIMTSADTLDVVSSSANDTSAGTGVRTIAITGVDANNLEQTEVVTLNGTTPVTTSNSWLGVNRVTVLTAGSGGAPAGNITIDDNGNSVGTQAYLPAGQNVTQQCIFHTPINQTFLCDFIWANIKKGAGDPIVTIYLRSYSRVTGLTYEVARFTLDADVELTGQISNTKTPLVFTGREVIQMVAETDTNNTEVSGRFSGKLIKSPSAE